MLKRTCCRTHSPKLILALVSALVMVGPAQAQETMTAKEGGQEAMVQQPLGQKKTEGRDTPSSQPPTAPSHGPGMQMPDIQYDPALADAAWQYLELVLLERFEDAAAYLTPASQYQNFSVEFFGRDKVDVKGSEAIMAYWREASKASATVEVRFEANDFFVAGPNVYFIGTTFVTNEGRGWGVNMDLLEFTFTQVSQVRMVDGKVTYHADHLDYAEAFEQLKAYMEEAGPWVPDEK